MPNSYTLVAIDISGIQDYVFRTNDLQHHLGASELVRRATGTWVHEHLPKPNNMSAEATLLDDKYIERGDVTAEVLYSGGGNAVILFADPAVARKFVADLSRKALIEAPGLNATIASRPLQWNDGGADLGAQVSELLGKELRNKKQSGHASGEMLGLSVTADCEFTGLPAVTIGGKENQRISAEIAAKLDYATAANDRLKREIGGDDYVRDFDEFGTKGEASYIAVIHADGNGMGKRFERLAAAGLPNRKYIQVVRALSRSVNEAAQAALKATADAIRNMWHEEDKLGGVVPVQAGKLPFRPIIFGGDDATFVCDGRLGLTVAAKYLEEFAKQSLDELNGKTHPSARAGIAIVKTHFPFGQAYRLAEELAQKAKRLNDKSNYGTLDWHFGINGIVADLETTRKRDYLAIDARGKHSLLMRPLRLEESQTEWRSWPVFAQLVNGLQNDQTYPSNKVKAFREALRDGPRSAESFIRANFVDKTGQQSLPPIPNNTADNGWVGEHCAYFDAIEAMEFFVPLEPRKEGGRP